MNITKTTLIYILLSILIINGCGSGISDNKTSQNKIIFSFTLPSELSKQDIPDLQAELSIGDNKNNSTPIKLEVDRNSHTTNVEMEKVLDENIYNFSLIYFVVINGQKIILATGSIKAEITNNDQGNNIKIANLNRNIDDDHDGFTNLAEVRIGTNPRDGNNRPQSSQTRNSVRYKFKDSLGDIAFDSGETKSQSGKYELNIGH